MLRLKKRVNSDMGYDTYDPTSVIDEGTDDQLNVTAYRFFAWRKFLFIFFTAGIGGLLLIWWPWFLICIACTTCPLPSADYLLIQDIHKYKHIVKVKQGQGFNPHYQNIPSNSPYLPGGQYHYFMFKCLKYIWDGHAYKRLKGLDETSNVYDLIDNHRGISDKEFIEKVEIYGPNLIDVVVSSYFRLLIEEILNPFYMFQVLSVILWVFDDYYYYASCIVAISIVSVFYSLIQTREQRVTLHDMVSHSNTITVTVLRDGIFNDIPSTKLVPGDIIAIPPNGCLMSCDAVLLTGSCIVNESMLTGESVPETKLPILKTEEIYTPDTHKKSTLFCGTHIIQTRYYTNQKVLALVIRTGYMTAKGQLIRSIMHPAPSAFELHKDGIRFVLCLFIVSIFGMAFSIYLYIKERMSLWLIIVRALDLVTIVVPPALPAAMTVSTVYSQRRLKKQKIFCISPQHINMGGKLKLICFDKTGTLTEDGLDLLGVLPSQESKFKALVTDITTLTDQNALKIGMATCHSLTKIQGELVGDPLDLNMFEATEWELEEPGSDNSRFDVITPTIVRPKSVTKVIAGSTPLSIFHWQRKSNDTIEEAPCEKNVNEDNELATLVSNLTDIYEIGIIKQFPFSSSLQRMAVITRALTEEQFSLFVKGAPEKIASLCNPESIPPNFSQILQEYTQSGHRVIAIAWKPLNPKMSWHYAQKVKRETIEDELNFLGLIVMQNMMKEETRPTIDKLQKANLKCVMVTGDNILTAISVARNCGMIPKEDRVVVAHTKDDFSLDWEFLEGPTSNPKDFHIAMEGNVFGILKTYHPELLSKVITKSTVFARMSPDQKTQLVENLKEIGYCVGMCGDGANDCGALKAANIGISLSEAEASVAAPFTSAIPNISCVPIVISEGRCVLVTSFSMFKFIAMYSLIQFTSVLVLYYTHTNLTDFMFLYIDIFIITFQALLMGYVGPSTELVPKRPGGRLVAITNLVPLVFHIFNVILTQIITAYLLMLQPWIEPNDIDALETITPNMYSSCIFYVSAFQYLTLGLVFSKGLPFRAPLYRQRSYMVSVVIIVVCNLFLLFDYYPKISIIYIFTWPIDYHMEFRVVILMVIGCFFFTAILIEKLVADTKWLKKFSRYFKGGPKNEYKALKMDFENSYFSKSVAIAIPNNI